MAIRPQRDRSHRERQLDLVERVPVMVPHHSTAKGDLLSEHRAAIALSAEPEQPDLEWHRDVHVLWRLLPHDVRRNELGNICDFEAFFLGAADLGELILISATSDRDHS